MGEQHYQKTHTGTETEKESHTSAVWDVSNTGLPEIVRLWVEQNCYTSQIAMNRFKITGLSQIHCGLRVAGLSGHWPNQPLAPSVVKLAESESTHL